MSLQLLCEQKVVACYFSLSCGVKVFSGFSCGLQTGDI